MQHNSANKFFDSLASGRPVAINCGGWQAELIEQYRCGICLDYDTGASAEKIAVLLRDESEMKEMGHNSRRLAEEQFDRDKLAADLRDVLEMSYRSAAP
jgi:glycosyltransferase involved in cell wall biosynthesis